VHDYERSRARYGHRGGLIDPAACARAVMADLFSDFPGPVLIGFPSGHTVTPAMTLPFGVAARVIAGPKPRLVIEEAAVE